MHNTRPWFNSRHQLLNRVVRGPTEFIQPSSVHPPFKSPTHVSAGQPELDTVGFVGHRILVRYEPGTNCRSGEKHTLIIVKRTLTVPKTAGAGVMLVASFRMFMASMAVLSDEIVMSRRFCCWGVEDIVEAGCSCEGGVWQAGCVGPNRDGRPFNTPRVNEESSIHGTGWQAERDRAIIPLVLRFAANPLCPPTAPLASNRKRSFYLLFLLGFSITSLTRCTARGTRLKCSSVPILHPCLTHNMLQIPG